MKKTFFTLLLLLAATTMNAQTIVKGDMNNDDHLTISDAVDIVNVILRNAPLEYINLGVDAVDNTSVVGKWYAPDGTSFMFNDDGTTTFPCATTYKFRPQLGILTLYDASGSPIKAIALSEVTANHLLSVDVVNGNKVFTEYTSNNPYPAHNYVDLGLPTGTLWATCNVGADNPWDYGHYFAWGETSPKDTYNWSTYKWCEGFDDMLTKYCTHSSFGTVDGKTELDLADDAAYVNWGTDWRMPTNEQAEELLTECTWTHTTMNNVIGYEVKSKKNGNSIFLPAAGLREDNSLNYTGLGGAFWARTLSEDYADEALFMYYEYDEENELDIINVSDHQRYYGYSIRPVRAK